MLQTEHDLYDLLGDAIGDNSWLATARPNQLPPAGDWFCWLLLAGRGFGKRGRYPNSSSTILCKVRLRALLWSGRQPRIRETF